MQDLVLSTCVENPYSLSEELIKKYFNIEMNEMRLYRVTDCYGEALHEVLDNNERLQALPQPDDVVYAMADGSNILTREAQWKEAKLGRIFNGKDCLQIEGKVNQVNHSQYVSHFGNCKDFTAKMDKVLDDYGNLGNRLIFISDGATWIRNWIEDAYPKAVVILDFFHAKEYLCDFAKEYYKVDAERTGFIEQQSALLLQSDTQQVIDTLMKLNETTQIPSLKRVIEYYQSNIKRMDYKYYQGIGKGLIGSGAMESSHRTVIQTRMKLSGQRWSMDGAKNMLCLRTIKMNNQWPEVFKLIKANAA
jgi:hypothetical protein